MPQFENVISSYLDARVSTLARIKTRSLGADTLVLSALTVLVYAQLEGGVKDISGCVIKHVNARNMELGEIAPQLLKWRNKEEIDRLKAMVDFDMIGEPSPFSTGLRRRVKVLPINRHRELNQMGSAAIKRVYEGFGLDDTFVQRSATKIDGLVGARNAAAHHGSVPMTAAVLLEGQVRENLLVVENVLFDLCIQLVTFFSNRKHLRRRSDI
jgi:RiboL-PSP-HEPN